MEGGLSDKVLMYKFINDKENPKNVLSTGLWHLYKIPLIWSLLYFKYVYPLTTYGASELKPRCTK